MAFVNLCHLVKLTEILVWTTTGVMLLLFFTIPEFGVPDGLFNYVYIQFIKELSTYDIPWFTNSIIDIFNWVSSLLETLY